MKRKLLPLASLLLLAHPLAADDTELLATRRAVWIAWFENDRKTLEPLLPADGLFLSSSGEKPWVTTAQTLESSRAFRAGGGKLVNLEFPATEVRHYGDLAVVATTYVLTLDNQGKRSVDRGKALEVFVRKDGRWLHPSWCLVSDPEPAKEPPAKPKP